jgi:hypothetical protein
MWKGNPVLDCESKAIPALKSQLFWTLPNKSITPLLKEIQTGTDFSTLNITGTDNVVFCYKKT